MTTATNRTRLLALGLFAFLGTFAAIVWYLMRPYGSVYFFPVHFLIGAALPFLIYAIGGTRRWFWIGMGIGCSTGATLPPAWSGLPVHGRCS